MSVGGGGDNVCKVTNVRRAQEAPVEGVVNVPFGEPHQAIRRICLTNFLQEPGKSCPKLYGVGGSIFVSGCADGGVDIVRCSIIVIDKVGISVCLLHGRKGGDTDVVAKNQQRHVHRKNNAEATLRLFQQFLLTEISSLRCQCGRMWESVNGGINYVQRPGHAYSSRAAPLCIFFEQRRRRMIFGGWWGRHSWALLSCKKRV